MLSKKKDSGINDGIAGKYVKRETPPMLRNYHTPVRQTPNFQRRSVKTPATFYVPQQSASNVLSSRTQVTTRSNVQSSVTSQETRAQQLSPLTQQRNTQSAPPQIAGNQLSQGVQNLSVADRSDVSGSTSSLSTQGSTTSSQGTSGYGTGPQPTESPTQQSSGQRNNLGAIREDFHEPGNLGASQSNYSDYHSQFDENYQIQQYHEEIRNHYAQQSGGHVTSTQHSLQSSTQQSSTSACKYSKECADKKFQYPTSAFPQNLKPHQLPPTSNNSQHDQYLNTTILGNQCSGNTGSVQTTVNTTSNLSSNQCSLSSVNSIQQNLCSSNMNTVESNQVSHSTNTIQHSESLSNLCNMQCNHSSTSTSTMQHSHSTNTLNQQDISFSNNVQHSSSSSSFQSFSSVSESTNTDIGSFESPICWQYNPLQQHCTNLPQNTNAIYSSVLSSSAHCSSSSIITGDTMVDSFVEQSSSALTDCVSTKSTLK